MKKIVRDGLPNYGARIDLSQPVWQPRYFSFAVFSSEKLLEKLDYIHLKPVRAKLVESQSQWPWSSARHYELAEDVGVEVSLPD